MLPLASSRPAPPLPLTPSRAASAPAAHPLTPSRTAPPLRAVEARRLDGSPCFVADLMGLAPGSSAAALWDLMQPRLMSPLLRAADAPRAHSEVGRLKNPNPKPNPKS